MTHETGGDGTGTRCPECGWHAPQPGWRRIRRWSPLHWVPLLAVVGLVAWGLRGSAVVHAYRSQSSFPQICQPAITRAQVEALAAGTAPAEVTGRVRDALTALLRLPAGFGTMPDRPRMLQAGFVRPPDTARTDFRGGLLTPWIWWARTVAAEDGVAAEPSAERPPVRLPGANARVERAPGAWSFWILDGPAAWSVTPWEIRYDLRTQRSAEFSAELSIDHAGDMALAALVVGVVANRLLRRCRPAWRWRRRAVATLAGLGVVAVALTGATFFGGFHAISTRGWAEAKGTSGWADLRLVGWSARDVAAALEEPPRLKALAAAVLEAAPVEAGGSPTYLAAVVAHPAPLQIQWWRAGEGFTVAEGMRSTIEVDAGEPPVRGLGGWRLYARYGAPTLAWRSDDGVASSSVTLQPGPCCWLLAAGLVAWCAPAAFVGAIRERRARRRLERGRCPCCAYHLAQAGGTSVST